jgi:4-hydroxy-L-threonine phosphate dehydrogenase PdxA
MTRPTIAITMGDPAGIGPEVIMKALAKPKTRAICNALVIGDANRLRKAGKIIGERLEVAALREADDADFDSGLVQCLDLNLVPDDLPFGKMSAAAGEAAYRFIEKAVQVVQAGSAQAICTAPLSKEALHAAGHKYPGHTELLAHLTGTPEVSMMLVSPRLRVIHVTTHIGLLDAIEKIEPGLVERVIVRGHEVLVRAGLTNPRIGVCAINPHAGENGLFGRGEEATKITPAIEACQCRGWDVRGPLPADTLFFLAGPRRLRHGRCDVS